MTALGWASLAQAQDVSQQPPADTPDAEEPTLDPGTIVVTSTRIKGQLIVDQPPVAEYDAEDIAAFGGSSIADILSAIEPASGSARGDRGGGRPVFLINGIRVSSFREFNRYPPEAVAKVEVFAEEVAQRFGFSPDQRVVNIVLKDDFSSLTAEVEFEMPADGGYSRNEQELGYLKIANGARLNFNLDVEDASLLTEAERGFVVTSTIPGIDDVAPFRSLVSDTSEIEGTANYARAFIDSGASISLNGTVTRSESLGLSGLRDVGGTIAPLETRQTTDSYAFAGGYNRNIGDWQATFTTDVVRALTETEIDRRDAAGFDIANSNTWTITNKATFTGYPIDLPAGEVSVAIDLGLDWRRIDSDDTRTDTSFQGTRRRLRSGVNVNIPIAERGGAWGAIGGLSLNLSGGAEDLSDFGALRDWTAGLNWSPFDNLNLQATRIWREVAPSLSNLGSPRVETFNVPVFDFATGQDVFATIVSGGNPNLVAETQADWKFGANWELPFWENTRFQVDYAINKSDDVTLSSPSFSAAFESAFPDRVTRDPGGDLLAIDRRPVTLFETRSRTLSFGLNTRGTVGKASEGGGRGEGGRGGASGPPAGAGERRGRPGGAGGFDPARMQQMRAQFCEAPDGQQPDLSQLPEQMRARLLGPDGQPDPEKVAQARERFCSAENSERFAAIRTAICADPPNLDALPPQMLERLKGPDGEIDQNRLAQMRERMCAADGAQAGGPPQRGGGGRGGFSPFGRGDSSQGRYFVSLNHTINLENEVLLAPGGPLFDQIDGQVIGGGAISRHSTRLEGGLFWGGYGLRLTGRYEGEAVVRGSGLPGSSDLFYGDLATVDLRVWATLGEVFKRDEGWMKGLRVALVFDNVFDGKRRVVDEDGSVPDAFDPRRIDPVGRYLGIDIRKQF
ncbi:hypothetical protein K3172_06695 [Qipengyuania sp. 6B39]|uniref:TonB-dependent receptor plug domain-containing protein n=1 Tax=Qipengyuania proteolytica TaxID=2867239 RepID=UPI001C8AE14E|nr:hypothetical protein [Qipengyuania proteolytica]MBX7495544.1 hypothetical protein [Qipengyuania proteolytica]